MNESIRDIYEYWIGLKYGTPEIKGLPTPIPIIHITPGTVTIEENYQLNIREKITPHLMFDLARLYREQWINK